MKHHTLLHRPQKQFPDQHTTYKDLFRYEFKFQQSGISKAIHQRALYCWQWNNHCSSFYISCNNWKFIERRNQAACSLRFRFTSQFYNRSCCKGAHAANSVEPNQCFYDGFFPFSKDSRLFATEVEWQYRRESSSQDKKFKYHSL